MESISKELLARLDKLAEVLGITVDKLWQVLVKQQPFYGILPWMFFVVSIILGLIMLSYLNKQRKDELWMGRIEDMPIFVIVTIIAFAGTLISLAIGIVNLGRFVNPEYYALQEILTIFKY